MRPIAPRLSAALSFAALSALVSPAQALMGDTVSCEGLASYRCSTPTAVVGAGVEFTSTANGFGYSLDFDASGLTVTVLSIAPGPSIAETFLFADLSTPFTTFSLASSSLPTLDASAVEIDTGALRLNVMDGFIAVGQAARINLVPATPAIPEPGSYALMAGGLALLGWLGRGRRRQGAVLR